MYVYINIKATPPAKPKSKRQKGFEDPVTPLSSESVSDSALLVEVEVEVSTERERVKVESEPESEPVEVATEVPPLTKEEVS